VLGAALLGVGGAAAGAAVGGTVEEGLGEGLPHEDAYLFEHSLRHGYSVVIVYASEGEHGDSAQKLLVDVGAKDVEDLREEWWADHREEEREYYQNDGRDFSIDELNYRRGYEASLNPGRRGQAFTEVEEELDRVYGDISRETAFREGYDRGYQYQASHSENRKV
jgi:hypothetical protein